MSANTLSTPPHYQKNYVCVTGGVKPNKLLCIPDSDNKWHQPELKQGNGII